MYKKIRGIYGIIQKKNTKNIHFTTVDLEDRGDMCLGSFH